MPPRKSRQTNEQEEPVAANPSKFQNLNVEKYFLELQEKTFIQERGFEPSMILCKETWVILWKKVDTHRSMDLSQYKVLYKQPKVRSFLPSPSNGTEQKGWDSNGNKQAIHETNEELYR
ncbi:hypothetical protein Golax_014439 [Gossypium laxum]|uniref:Uncharacterized protein n=1 Tax=Gossypium laxum TaxID=34288 RepID=A0A7J8ZW68_9ROSI|nr:hypothetical protein [Gossypium laxum]